MKLIMSLIFFLLIAKVGLASGITVGNGGNAVVCRTEQEINVELLDYYELRLNGGELRLNAQLTDYQSILTELFDRWEPYAPIRMRQYKKWLRAFQEELALHSGVTIPAIPDTGTIVIPIGCELKPIAFQRPDSEVLFPGVKRYTINKDLWILMSEVQKAGLVLHELIYREGIKAGHTTSFPTRYFNSYLASAKPNAYVYAGVVSQMPLLWTEYGQQVVIQIGEVRGSMGCPTCHSFYRQSAISQDGQWIYGEIIEIFSDLVTEDFAVRFSQKGAISELLKIGFQKNSFVVNTRSSLIKEVEVMNQFKFTLQKPDYFELSVVDGYIKANMFFDPSQSWFKNKDQNIIDQITSVNYNVFTSFITTSNLVWKLDYRQDLNGYIVQE